MSHRKIRGHAPKFVLCVDDQFETLMALQGLLEGNGYGFRSAASGVGRLNLLKQTTPHLILLDIQMPGMDGFETCRRLRRIPPVARTPVAFLTGRKAPEDVEAGIAAGGHDFIVKPFDYEKLLARVSYWTGKTTVIA